MKILPLLVLLMNPASAADTLEEFQWKKRLLVITRNEPKVEKSLQEKTSALSERDVMIFVLEGGPDGLVPSPELKAELLKRLKVRENKSEVLLLGKDGRTTVRWNTADFTVEKLIREIDSMPMRQKEMRR